MTQDESTRNHGIITNVEALFLVVGLGPFVDVLIGPLVGVVGAVFQPIE